MHLHIEYHYNSFCIDIATLQPVTQTENNKHCKKFCFCPCHIARISLVFNLICSSCWLCLTSLLCSDNGHRFATHYPAWKDHKRRSLFTIILENTFTYTLNCWRFMPLCHSYLILLPPTCTIYKWSKEQQWITFLNVQIFNISRIPLYLRPSCNIDNAIRTRFIEMHCTQMMYDWLALCGYSIKYIVWWEILY